MERGETQAGTVTVKFIVLSDDLDLQLIQTGNNSFAIGRVHSRRFRERAELSADRDFTSLITS
jgi:hypothetical protein